MNILPKIPWMHFAWRAILELSGNPVAAAPMFPVAPDFCAGMRASVDSERMSAVYTDHPTYE
jgi:hypothetical protein